MSQEQPPVQPRYTDEAWTALVDHARTAQEPGADVTAVTEPTAYETSVGLGGRRLGESGTGAESGAGVGATTQPATSRGRTSAPERAGHDIDELAAWYTALGATDAADHVRQMGAVSRAAETPSNEAVRTGKNSPDELSTAGWGWGTRSGESADWFFSPTEGAPSNSMPTVTPLRDGITPTPDRQGGARGEGGKSLLVTGGKEGVLSRTQSWAERRYGERFSGGAAVLPASGVETAMGVDVVTPGGPVLEKPSSGRVRTVMERAQARLRALRSTKVEPADNGVVSTRVEEPKGELIQSVDSTRPDIPVVAGDMEVSTTRAEKLTERWHELSVRRKQALASVVGAAATAGLVVLAFHDLKHNPGNTVNWVGALDERARDMAHSLAHADLHHAVIRHARGGGAHVSTEVALPSGSNPSYMARHALVAAGEKPTDVAVKKLDAEIGGGYMKAHHLGRYSWGRWSEIARHLRVGTKLLIPKK